MRLQASMLSLITLVFALLSPQIQYAQTILPDRPVLVPMLSLSKEQRFPDQLYSAAKSYDGDLIFSLPGFCEGSWSPNGTTLACNTQKRVFLVNRVGRSSVLSNARDGSIFFWTPSWSPQGDRIALVSVQFGKTIGKNAWFLEILNTKDGAQISRTQLPNEVGKHMFPIMCAFPITMCPPDKFTWSPDGKYILVSWGIPILYEIQTDKIIYFTESHSIADWDSRGLLWVLEFDNDAKSRLAALYRYDPNTIARETLATVESFTASGLKASMGYGVLNFSPSGNQLALILSADYSSLEIDVIRIYETKNESKFDYFKPMKEMQSGPVLALDWSPDEKKIAVSRLDLENMQVVTDLIEIATGNKKQVSTIPTPNMYKIEEIAYTKHIAWTR
jgi:Tol biopolymer transport system component